MKMEDHPTFIETRDKIAKARKDRDVTTNVVELPKVCIEHGDGTRTPWQERA